MTESQRATRASTAAMLRRLRAGDRVVATLSSPRTGSGTVLDPDPFLLDGVRRVKVQWDDGATVNVLPPSIRLESE